MPLEMELRARLEAFLERHIGEPVVSIEELVGGASLRRFFRAKFIAGAEPQRGILMLVPPEAPELALVRERGRRWPFLEIAELLAARGVRVPRIWAEDCSAGLLLVEDLGDETLAQAVATDPDAREPLYRLAVEELARAQRELAQLPADSVVRLRKFDTKLLRWEIDHFWKWGIEARSIPASAAQRDAFQRAAGYLSQTIAALPQRFVHRDYQSRNLMVRWRGAEPTLHWIDFQDALLGPEAYDLVALLADSYQPFTPDFVRARLEDYAQARALSGPRRAELWQEFLQILVQRKLKDAGRFVFIQHQKGDSSYLGYIEPTLDMVRWALTELAHVKPLAALRSIVDARPRREPPQTARTKARGATPSGKGP